MAEAGGSGSGGADEQGRDVLAEAQAAFDQGVACIKENDLDKAVELLGEALELRVGHYGSDAVECAATYAKYGAALLYKAQDDNAVFGGPGGAGAQAQAAPGAANGGAGAKGKGAAEEEDASDGDDDDDEGGEDADLGNEPATDMELAWEMLETARVLYTKAGGCDDALAGVYERLGDVSMEQEQFDKAMEDYEQALELLQKCCTESDDRRIAGVLHTMALTLQMQERPLDAFERCNAAVHVLQARLARLRGVQEKATTAGEPVPATLERELAELEGVLSDLQAKEEELQEAIDEQAEMKKTIKQAFAGLAGGVAPGAGTASTSGAPAQASAAAPAATGTALGFDAPKLAPADAGPVQHLGVVGRGRNKVTAVPVVPAADTLPKVRKLDDEPTAAAEDKPAEKRARVEPVPAAAAPAEGAPNGCPQQ